MGKGGTKFVGEAIAHRSGRAKSTYTNKELRKNMEKFLETGVHPDFQKAQASNQVVYPLPDPDPHRPHVFMDLTIENRPLGRLVIELFEDVAPAAARHLMNRCLPGSQASLLNSQFHKLLPYYGLFGGKSQSAAFAAGQSVPANNRLQHMMRGAVSVSRDGSEFAISLGRSLVMDETHQVVGRIGVGLDLLDDIDDIPRSPDDVPMWKIRVAKCGATNAKGTHEALEEALTKETPEAAAARLKQQSADTRNAVMEALQQGMGHKRTADEAGIGPSSSKAAAATAGDGDSNAADTDALGTSAAGASSSKQQQQDSGSKQPAAAGKPNGGGQPSKRSKVLDSLLDELESGTSSDDSSSQQGD